MKGTFGIVGAGNMATAILDGSLHAGFLVPAQVVSFDVNPEKQQMMAVKGLSCAATLADLAAQCDYILLSVKPQVAPKVLAELGASLRPDTVIISIAAGISADAIAHWLGIKAPPLVLVMPNTPLMVGMGATAICRTDAVDDSQFAFAKELFAAAGVVEEIPADRLNETIAVHGSTPAYIYLITKYFCEYAAGQGIPYETAKRLFCQTLAGSAKMMTETGKTIDELITMVSSPGGTTLKGLESLEESGIQQTIEDCCDATLRRAVELGAENS